MWELTKRISLRILSVLSKVEPEPDLYTGSDQKVPAPAPQHWSPVAVCSVIDVCLGTYIFYIDNDIPPPSFLKIIFLPSFSWNWIHIGVMARSESLKK